VSGLQTARSSRANVLSPNSHLSADIPHGSVLSSVVCCRPARKSKRSGIDYTFEPTHRSPQFAVACSAGPVITDIWRTGSGQSKRFGEPLAVADGDGIRRHPARLVTGHLLAARQTVHSPYPRNPDFTG
jgi:hypothetical protein